MSVLNLLLIILLLILIFGALPQWPHAVNWGYGPSGIGLVLLVIVIVLLFR